MQPVTLGVWSVSLNDLRFEHWFRERDMMSNKPHQRPHQEKRQGSRKTRLLVAILIVAIFALVIALEATGHVVFRGRLTGHAVRVGAPAGPAEG